MTTILVQVADAQWTCQAIQAACDRARQDGSTITLLRLIPVQHLGHLGTAFGNLPPDKQEYELLQQCAGLADAAGVELTVCSMQCVSTLDAVAEAAAHVGAAVVFAQVQDSLIPYWHRVQVWNLKRQLEAQKCQLFMLDGADAASQPIASRTFDTAASAK